MRTSAAACQQISGSFQISGKCMGPTRAGLGIATYGYASPGIPKGKGRHLDWLSIHIYADGPEEVQMNIGSVILVLWLVVGGFAAGQRGDYKGPVNCSNAATAAITILAGPLNYMGVNPQISCTVQSHSS
jgi:hypothetical protein